MTGSKTKKLAEARLPADVHADLVETLFGTLGSFVSGLIGGLIIPVITWLRTGDPVFVALGGVILILSAFRVGVLIAHNVEDEETRRARAVHWERLYAVGAIGFMIAVGVTSAVLLERHRDELSAFYGLIVPMGMLSALAPRNAGRPMIVFGQVLGVCSPVAITLLFHFDVWYWGLAAILGLVMSSVKSTTRFLNGMLVSALLNGREARIQRTRLGTALDSMSHGLCMADNDGRVSVVNRRLQESFGLSGNLVSLTVRELAERMAAFGRLPPLEWAAFVQSLERHASQRDSGVFSETLAGRIYDFRCEPMDNGGVVIVVEDVTEARLATREVERMAAFDTLTGLPNRHQFHSRLKTVLGQLPASGQQTALISIDLDQFKEVNDTLGHPMGDKLLCHVADRLRETVRDLDIVARFGGDEFAILLQPSFDPPDATALPGRLIEAISARYFIDGHTIRIGASIGIALAPRDALNVDDLLKCADLALYSAKAAGRSTFRYFAPAMDAAMRRKREMEQELRLAIGNEELELHYQPVVDTRSGAIVGCEALVRWRHPSKGLIAPGEFIPLAEETGLIVQIGEWVLLRACRDARFWPAHVRLAVNVSARQFALSRNFGQTVREALEGSGLDPGRLEIEITESTVMEASEARAELAELAAAKVRVSLDDFGTGYSSLSYLRQFPVDKIKIDRSFIRDHEDLASHAVIGAVAFLARTLHIELVMEGVETREQLEALRRWDVHLVQGFLFSPPVPLAELLPVLAAPVRAQQRGSKVA